jgi:hypothetical protein
MNVELETKIALLEASVAENTRYIQAQKNELKELFVGQVPNWPHERILGVALLSCFVGGFLFARKKSLLQIVKGFFTVGTRFRKYYSKTKFILPFLLT